MISYYELLEMIKKGNIPKKVNYKIYGYLDDYVEYTAQYDGEDFTHYELTFHTQEDENRHFYLNENYLESDMFNESILIIENTPEEDKKIGKLFYYNKKDFDNLDEFVEITTRDVFDKINEIIDYINDKGV